MQKVIIILLIGVSLTGCSAGKNQFTGTPNGSGLSTDEIVRRTAEKNLANDGFFINKGKISTSGEAGSISLYFTMKYKLPGIYLISLRSKTGMEAFRVYLSRDTVLINDRINQNVLIGKISDFERIAGIPADLLKISFGDIFYNLPKANDSDLCNDKEFKIEDYFLGLIIKTTIDCNLLKPKQTIISSGSTEEYINIEYKKYRGDKKNVPKIMEVNDFRRKIKIRITVNKYSTPWFGDIQFIPGRGYVIKPLI